MTEPDPRDATGRIPDGPPYRITGRLPDDHELAPGFTVEPWTPGDSDEVKGIDVAILPTWYLTGSSELVLRHIAPRQVIASHVWEGDTTKIKRDVRREWPNAIVLVRPGERVQIQR